MFTSVKLKSDLAAAQDGWQHFAKGILTVAAAFVTCLRLDFLKYSSDGEY